MRYFRKRQTQPADAGSAYKKDLHSPIVSMPLMYEDNRAFLKDRREKLAWPQEVYGNLEASTGITRPGGRAIGVGCGSVFFVGLGVLFTFMGMIMAVAAIDTLLRSPHLTPEMSTTAVMLAGGMIFLLFWGPGAMMQSYLAEQDRVYVTSLYNQLIAQGQIVEGTVINIEQTTPQMIIHYRFTVPSQCENCEGQYKLLTQQTFALGQKVTVLYLNRCVQVLL